MPAPDTSRAHASRVRVIHAKSCPADGFAALIAAHEQALASGDGKLKKGRRSAVTRLAFGGQALCVKEYRPCGVLDRVKDSFRGSRGRAAWQAAAELARRGVPTPEPVALLERGKTSYLVTRFVGGSLPLDRILCERFSKPLSTAELAAKRAMVRQLAQWLRRVHDLGIYHDDWSTKNILVAEGSGRWSFYFLDLESVAPGKRLTYRRRVKNLGQISDAPLGVTRTDRMRFLVAYAAGDRSLMRGRFPRDVLAAARRRDEDWARVLSKTRKRKAKAAKHDA
jgi:tRNA A-37 threonylcarbamoyl transferase component Bud32